MYGKIFETLYEGSMVGKGALVFAVWGYIIAKMRPDKQVGAQVDLNPELLAFILGEKTNDVNEAVEFLSRPDPISRSSSDEGRRIVQVGQFSYRVVNGAKYMAIKNAEERREYNRNAKRKERAAVNGKIKRKNIEQAMEDAHAERRPRKLEEPPPF